MFKPIRSILFLPLVLVAMFGYSQVPTISSFSPAAGAVGTLVTINGTNLATPIAFSIGGVTALVVNNTGTVLTGFVMPGAVTGAISLSTSGGSATGSGNFTVTPTLHPTEQQGAKLVSTGSVGQAQQGESVAVSADGNTAIVGSPSDNSEVGAALIYTRSGGTWSQQGSKLVGTGNLGPGGSQGTSVAISADGNTAIVGASYDNSQHGAAWVFIRSGGNWSQQGSKLVGTGGTATGEQGIAVSLSADGNTAVMGSTDGIWVFTRSGGVWSQQGNQLVATGGVGPGGPGYSVSISADGNTIIAGGLGDNSNQGAAWVFIRSGNTWAQQGSKLVGDDNTGAAGQGSSVSLSADGNTAIVGGSGDNTGQGAAWVFTRSGGAWSQQGSKLVGNDNTGAAGEGNSVSLSADGNTAIVGGYTDNNNQGAAWVFTRGSGNTWSQQGSKLVGTGSTDTGNGVKQGFSVAINADGSTAFVGGYVDNDFVGAAWVFTASPAITSFSPTRGPVGTLVTINGTNLSTPTAFTIGGQSAIVVSNTGSTLVAMVMPGAVTGGVSISTAGGTASGSGNFTVTATKFPSAQQGSKLVGTGSVGPTPNIFQGSSVSLSADGNTAIVGGWYDNSQIGAAWVYTRSGGSWTQQGSKLVGTGSIGTQVQQGTSVCLSADGNTAIVGGAGDNSGLGAAWVYTRSNGTWTQQGSKLVGTGNVGTANQGISVSLSADGNTALIGGDVDNSQIGAVWIYTRSGGSWAQQGQKLVGTGSVGIANQGISVSLSADGNTALIGANSDNSNQGAAWVYIRSGNTWVQQGSKLVGTGNVGAAQQGQSVSLSADGNTAIVGGDFDNSSLGASWVYTRSGGAWNQQGSKLVGTGGIGIAVYQGHSVSLSADGNTAVIGGNYDNSGLGAVWVYTRNGNSWAQQGSKLVGTGSIGTIVDQGYSISLSADGNTDMFGGILDNSGQGAAWVFITSSNASLTTIALTPASTLTNTGTSGSTTTYTTSVGNGVTSVTATPTTNAPTATITVDGIAVTSGTASASIPLTIGKNTIAVVVTAQDGVTTQTYNIIVGRGSYDAFLSHIAASGTLTPVAGTTNYTATVNGATFTVTPTTSDPNATVKINGTLVKSGTASATIPLSVGANTVTTIVTAQDGVTTKTYIITVTRLSNNAFLSHIAASAALTPVSGTNNYTASVTNAISTFTVTPTCDPTAMIKVNGISVLSGTASGAILLSVGTNTVTTIVTAQDGITTKTYIITVTRAKSSNSNLAALKISGGTLAPAFAAGTINYTASVATTTTSVTPTTADPTATIKVAVNGGTATAVTSATASGNLALNVGANTITTVVTAQDLSTKTYTVTVTRLSNNAFLSHIAASATLTPVAGTNNYTASVTNAISTFTVTPTCDPTATIKVNGTAVMSGTASAAIPLSVGTNTVTTIVTAQDGITTKTYIITVTRATGPLMSLYLPISVVRPADSVTIENDGVMVHQGVSPNGDGVNDVLTIDGITAYPDNKLTIIDRSGFIIFETKGYNNIAKVFDGHSSINGRMLQPGTYFYSLDYVVDGQSKHKTGFIILKY